MKKKNQNKSQLPKDKEMDMHIDVLRELENQKTNYVSYKYSKLSAMKSLKSNKSCPDIFANYNLNKTNRTNNIRPNNKFNITKSFFKSEREESKDKERKNNNDSNFDLIPLNYDAILKKNKKKFTNNKILKMNDFFKNIKNNGYKLKNIRLNKLKEIKENRDVLFKQKLRNLYYSDLEKILLSERKGI